MRRAHLDSNLGVSNTLPATSLLILSAAFRPVGFHSGELVSAVTLTLTTYDLERSSNGLAHILEWFMSTRLTRREFVLGFGACTLLASMRGNAVAKNANQICNSILGLSSTSIKFGYAAITWNGNDKQAIEEISAVGFRGIQLRNNILKEFEAKPDALRELLNRHKLELVALSSGGVEIAPHTQESEVEKHLRNAKFVKAVGGHYLQLTDSARKQDRAPTDSDFKQLGHVLNSIAKRSVELGIPVGYHNHMGSLGQAPDEIDQIMGATDPRYVKLELDIAHYLQGGGDPAKAIRQYRDRLLFLHIKDVESLANKDSRGRDYRWVELGRGRVDLRAVFNALHEINFNGWAIVELDIVPNERSTPRECAETSKKFIEEELKLKIRPD